MYNSKHLQVCETELILHDSAFLTRKRNKIRSVRVILLRVLTNYRGKNACKIGLRVKILT